MNYCQSKKRSCAKRKIHDAAIAPLEEELKTGLGFSNYPSSITMRKEKLIKSWKCM